LDTRSTLSTSASVAGSTSTVATTTPVTPPAPVVKTTTPAKPVALAVSSDVAKQPTLITKVKQLPSGSWQGTFDYVQFLTGSAALKAAKAHGDTVDNDYYVVNDNKKLRTFPLSSGVVIQLHPGSGPTYSRYFTIDEFKTLLEDGTATYGGKYYTGNGMYYIDVKNGQVTRIETLWVP
jgi:hypothetical protein